MKKLLSIGVLLCATFLLAGCPDDANVAKKNLTKAADNFELMRRVVFLNTWTGENVLIIEGRCNIEYGNIRTSVICKVGPNMYKRNFLGNSGQVTAYVEQMAAVPVNVYHYRRTFKPQVVIPDIDFRGSGSAIINAVTPDNND
jgi:hypothetical protein